MTDWTTLLAPPEVIMTVGKCRIEKTSDNFFTAMDIETEELVDFGPTLMSLQTRVYLHNIRPAKSWQNR